MNKITASRSRLFKQKVNGFYVGAYFVTKMLV